MKNVLYQLVIHVINVYTAKRRCISIYTDTEEQGKGVYRVPYKHGYMPFNSGPAQTRSRLIRTQRSGVYRVPYVHRVPFNSGSGSVYPWLYARVFQYTRAQRNPFNSGHRGTVYTGSRLIRVPCKHGYIPVYFYIHGHRGTGERCIPGPV